MEAIHRDGSQKNDNTESRAPRPGMSLALLLAGSLLMGLMNQTWPEQIVFLPTDDRLFSSGRVPINSEGTIYVGAPKRHYDVFILLPLAHRQRFDY